MSLNASFPFSFLGKFQVYGGEARISTLRKLFPLMEDKKSLASAEELAKVEGKASLLAAVDYYVSMKSDIFISASPGNMHNALVRLQQFSVSLFKFDFQFHLSSIKNMILSKKLQYFSGVRYISL